MIDYVLPLRWESDRHLPDLTAYLRWLTAHARVIVVDGSGPLLFGDHADAWSDLVQAGTLIHVPPSPYGWLNGKVNGVHTGVALATAEDVVIADDDVRYDEDSLRRTIRLLDQADLVGPQNVFWPMPWHAKWDTARSLLNRSVCADYPGTFAIRRSTWQAMGGYDGNVLFENLELMRTVRAAGGRVLRPRDIYVVRRPATVGGFLSQRVRQAYDDIAQPWRLATYLPVVPLALSDRARRAVAAGLLASVAVAEVGRRRGSGRSVFPAVASLFAPAWVLERSVCSWVAVGQRVLLGGVRYAGQRLHVAAHSPRTLRRRLAPPLVAVRGPETAGDVRAVAERLASRPPASTQRDRAATRVDLVALAVDDSERAAHEERSVDVRSDHGRFSRHAATTARDAACETERANA